MFTLIFTSLFSFLMNLSPAADFQAERPDLDQLNRGGVTCQVTGCV